MRPTSTLLAYCVCIVDAVSSPYRSFGLSNCPFGLESVVRVKRKRYDPISFRGGATLPASEDEMEEEDEEEAEEIDEEMEEEEDQDDETEEKAHKAPLKLPPISIAIKTTILSDKTLELEMSPSRTIGDLKDSLRKQLPGKPPVSTTRIVDPETQQVLRDDVVLQSLVEANADEEDEGSFTLHLDSMLPIDSKTLKEDVISLNDKASVSELLDAYLETEAVMEHNRRQMLRSRDSVEDDEEEEQTEEDDEEPLITEIHQTARELRENLISTMLSSPKVEKLLADETTPLQERLNHTSIEVKGNRVRRVTTRRAVSALNRNLLRTLNVQNWPATLWNVCLCLLLGYFGGRTPSSRAILYLGAPLALVGNARPIRRLVMQVAYFLLLNQPKSSVILSLIPAPQQLIISLNEREIMHELYDVVDRTGTNETDEEDDDADEEEIPQVDDDGEEDYSDFSEEQD